MDLQELIKERFSKQRNSQAYLYAILHKSVLDTIQVELNMDVSDYIESVKLQDSKVFIKTNSSHLSEEIQNISWKLEKNIQEKLENLWKKLTTLDIIVK